MTEMKLSIIHLIVMSAVFSRTEEAKYATITVIPNATVAVINDTTFLNCSSTSGEAEWLFAPNQYDHFIIYSYGNVTKPYQSRFRVENYSMINGSQFNLILQSVRENDAGRYICQNPRNTSEDLMGREAHLTVLVTEPVCKSDLKVSRLIGLNSCVINPHVSCSVRYIGNQVPELQWKKNGENIPISSSICSDSGNVFTCNLTIKSELELEEYSYSCVTTQSRTRKYSCTSGVSSTQYVSGDHTELNKTVNDIANCSVNSSQECTTSWNFDNGTATWTESHEQIIKFERPGRFFCEATCESRNMTCSLITMTVNVKVTAEPQDDNGLSFGAIVGIVAAVIGFILISFLIFLLIFCMWNRRRQKQQKAAVGQDPEAVEEVPLIVLDNEGTAVGQDPVAIEEVPLNVLDNEGAAVGRYPVAKEEVPLNVLDNEGTTVGQDPVAIEEVPLIILDKEGTAVGQDRVAIEEVPLNVLDNEGTAVGQDPVAIKEVSLNVLDNEGFKSSDSVFPYCDFRKQMKQLSEKNLDNMLKDEAYSKIRQMMQIPRIEEDNAKQFWKFAFPYVVQRVKMWNGYVLTAQNIADLVIRRQKKKAVVTDSLFVVSGTKKPQKIKASEESVYPVSRLDCMTYLINIADCIVAHDMFRIMSKFPMAIPFIVQDIYENDNYIVTVPIIQNNIIKWESSPGQIAENHLFTSPFRMVAAIRLGTNKIGKSTILNQLMSKPFLFSSKGEAGSRYGRPCTLDGAVEIVWLTQETCSNPTWKTTMSEYYKGNTEEVAILANLHGSVLQHPETLKYLAKVVCSFIVFLMPDFSAEEFDQLKQIIKRKISIQVLVDPPDNVDEEDHMNIIRTESLSNDDTLDTMRCLLKESLGFHKKKASKSIAEIYNLHASLRYAEPLHCKQSAEIVDIARNLGCFKIKQLLQSADIKKHAKWDYNLRRLIKSSLEIICPPTMDAKKYLTHLETNLSQISANESIAARAEVSEANRKLRRIVKAPKKPTIAGNNEDKQMEEDLKQIQKELKEAMNKVDDMNLGQEHFFRTLSRMYENSLGVADFGQYTAVLDLPKYFADLLTNGHAIEMLDGDSGNIQLIWIKAICDSVLNEMPNLKVFVISIIGLQSSGKSTLLNALFSCRFAVSVGRCSRGLFMRMIFLDEALRTSHGYDAVILIDTEGLSSPEKMNDPRANQKDRLMATYAIGISNLTIVNILGEGMTEMTEILQIAIVAMARLREGGIKPDILMVQHLQERNISKIDQAKGQFCEAIKKAFELISKNDVEIGSASAECLAELTARIHSGDLFQHFGPFKDGSSVNSPPSESYHDDVVSLLETILKRTEVSESKSSFERWCNHLESYWKCVQEENFALNFKNVKHITEYLYFEKKVAKVRELYDRAIRCHREIFSKNIRELVSSQISKNSKTKVDLRLQQNLLQEIEQQMQLIPHSCPNNCEECRQFSDSHIALLEELSNSEWREVTKRSLENQKTRLHEITMKMLRQTFDGSLVRQGCFSKFSDLITTELKEALMKRPDGIYSAEEQKEITKSIWEYLQDIAAGMEDGPDLETRLSQTLIQEYCDVYPSILKDFKEEVAFDQIANSKATGFIDSIFRMFKTKLTEEQMKNLISEIKQLVERVFWKRCEDFCATGLNFEEGMIGDIKATFPNAIKTFENVFRLNLQDKFKRTLQLYTLQHFRRKMIDLQKLWDSQNKPSEILQQKKQDYITEIEARLKSGFTSAGEGEVVATKLCNAAKKKAIQAGYAEKVQYVKDLSWTTNSEKVRLCYFEELANEVGKGNKERALQHFKNPKDGLQKWYKQRVNLFLNKDKVMNIYESTLKGELNRLVLKISNCTTEPEISDIVEEYIKAYDDQYYSKLISNCHDFEAFKASIEHKLKSFNSSNDRKDIVFPLASDDLEIMGRLGCTAHCFWCGALCWGSRDHQLDQCKPSEIETHHSCHQPSGLRGLRSKRTTKLLSGACHNRADDDRVFFGEHRDDEGLLWSVAKRDHFSDWKFDVHCITTFDELMRWFFQELHQDIAKNRGSLPADEKDLRENKCKNLELNEILKVVQHKF